MKKYLQEMFKTEGSGWFEELEAPVPQGSPKFQTYILQRVIEGIVRSVNINIGVSEDGVVTKMEREVNIHLTYHMTSHNSSCNCSFTEMLL